MDASDFKDERPSKRQRLSAVESGPYVLRSVLQDIPLNTEQGPGQVSITCVEYWSRCAHIHRILDRYSLDG